MTCTSPTSRCRCRSPSVHATPSPTALAARALPGARVVCPFGPRRLVGVVLGAREGAPPKGAQTAPLACSTTSPSVPPICSRFLRDLAAYYFAPIGEVMRLALPPVERETARELAEPALFAPKARGVGARRVQWVAAAPGACERGERSAAKAAAILAHLRAPGGRPSPASKSVGQRARRRRRGSPSSGSSSVEEREAPGDPFFAEPPPRDVPPEATRRAGRRPSRASSTRSARPRAATFLLHGVTGSRQDRGLPARHRRRARGAAGRIVLVPEIALTPQLVARFRARFGDDVAVLHSALTPRERHAMWTRLRAARSTSRSARAARSSRRCRDLGLVIVDEEHDSSLQARGGRALPRARHGHPRARTAPAACASSAARRRRSRREHLARTRQGARSSAFPTARARSAMPRGRARRPPAHRRRPDRRQAPQPPAPPRHRGDARAPASRRSSSSTAAASRRACAARPAASSRPARPARSRSPSTSAAGACVRCHYCDFESAAAGGVRGVRRAHALALEGLGHREARGDARRRLPRGARRAARPRRRERASAIEAVLARMRAREIDILVGTQMVTKGHDLPNVTLVGRHQRRRGALASPTSAPRERAFQLLVQVAGRAGRGDAPGRVLVQTCDPEHPAIALRARHDVDGLPRARARRPARARLPAVHAPRARARRRADRGRGARGVRGLGQVARAAAERAKAPVDVLGPAAGADRPPAQPLAFPRHAAERGPRGAPRRPGRSSRRRAARIGKRVRAAIDVDPVQLL